MSSNWRREHEEIRAGSEALEAFLRDSERPRRERAYATWRERATALTDDDLDLIRRLSPEAADRAAADRRRALDEPSLTAVKRPSLTAVKRASLTAALRPRDIVFRNALLQQLNDDAIEVAVKYDIRVLNMDEGGGLASPETWTVAVAPVTNEDTYAVFLHEVGHLVDPDGDGRQHRYRIEGKYMFAVGAEIGAWRWAVRHARSAVTWTAAMNERMSESLASYAREATSDECQQIANFITWATLQIQDRPDTFARLEERIKAITSRGTNR